MLSMNNNFRELRTSVQNQIDYLSNKGNLFLENMRTIIEEGGDSKLRIAMRKYFGEPYDDIPEDRAKRRKKINTSNLNKDIV
jgi:hypothetical protein